MKNWILALVFFASTAEAQVLNGQGEVLNICRVWDGTDVALVDASGNLMVGDGTGAFNVIVDSSALPTGAATAALQLPDGHNVTVDNAAGAAAVNIQDGGNAITVDGTVAANQGTAAASTASWPTKAGTVAAVTAAWTDATPDETTLALTVTGYSTVIPSLSATATMSGQIDFEVRDSGSVWFPVECLESMGPPSLIFVIWTLDTTPVIWQCNVAGFDEFRIRLSTPIIGTGTATIRIQASNAGPAPVTTVQGTVTVNQGGTFGVQIDGIANDVDVVSAPDPSYTDATGTTVPANAAFVAGTDGTNTRALKTDASGELQVDVLSMPTTTVTATDLDVQIGGSDTVTVTGTVGATQSGSWSITNQSFAANATTAGGTSVSRTVSAASTNATNVKASFGQVYQIVASNVNAAARFVHLYNASGAPTCNASIIATFILPGNATGAGSNITLNPGLAFGTGIGFCITTANDGTGAVGASDVVLNVFYK